MSVLKRRHQRKLIIHDHSPQKESKSTHAVQTELGQLSNSRMESDEDRQEGLDNRLESKGTFKAEINFRNSAKSHKGFGLMITTLEFCLFRQNIQALSAVST